jgi:hypothetical protein
MTDHTALLQRSETLTRLRGLFLFILAVSVLGIGATFAARHIELAFVSAEDIPAWRGLFQGLWLIGLMGVVIINRRIGRNPMLKSLINDERAKMQRLRAFAIGFWVFVVSVVVALLGAIFIDLDLKSTLLFVLCLAGPAPAWAQAFVAQRD